MPKNTLYTYDPKKRKKVKVGQIIGKAIVLKRNSKKHLMRVMDGYGIQAGALRDMFNAGVEEVRIHENDTGLKWKSNIYHWQTRGKLADYGNGKQYFLSRKHMQQYKPSTTYPTKQERAK